MYSQSSYPKNVRQSTKSTDGDAGLHAVVKNSEKFAGSYLKKLTQIYPENVITSPISIQAALAMASYGANGRTGTQMKSALKVPRGTELGQSGYQSVNQILKKVRGAELRLSTKIYTASYVEVRPVYEQMVVERFHATCEALDFTKPAAAAKVINNWCEEQTNKRIKNVVLTATLPVDTKLMLLNAVYFKGYWEKKFNPALTKPRPFHVDENTIKRVPTMFIERKFLTAEIPKLDARIVEIPYEESLFATDNETRVLSKRISKHLREVPLLLTCGAAHFLYWTLPSGSVGMVIVLPNQVNGLARVLEGLDKVNLNQRLQAGSVRFVNLYLPKFKIKKQLDLNPVLEELGMLSMFQFTANFSGMTEVPVFMTKVLQAAFIEVNEEGSETSDIGKQTRESLAASLEFRVDRPFYFAIQHRSTGLQLFSGVIHHPSSK